MADCKDVSLNEVGAHTRRRPIASSKSWFAQVDENIFDYYPICVCRISISGMEGQSWQVQDQSDANILFEVLGKSFSTFENF